MTGLAIALSLLAALLFAIAAVAQQHEAAATEDRGARLFLALVKSPRWWAGTVSDNVGYLVQAAALGVGSLLLVQPLLVTMLLFALPLGARYAGRRVTRASLGWAAALTIALAVFLVAGNPDPGVDNAPFGDWVVALGVCGGALVVGGVVALRPGRRRALGLAIVTGVLFGLVSGFTKTVTDQLANGIGPLLSSWETYALIVVGIGGFVAQQTAFQAGSLEISFPAATVLEPVTAAVVGLAVLQERVRADGVEWVLIGVSVLVMVVATASLARAGVPTPTTGTAAGTAPPSLPTAAARTPPGHPS
jgi:hypothetical protein